MKLQDEEDSYRSPWVSAVWSAAFPGFGQLYNRDYLPALVFIALEILVNMKSNLNLSIFYTFKGQLVSSSDAANTQWMLTYPCIYAFSIWQAYNTALDHNRRLEAKGAPRPAAASRLNGVFIGAAMGGTLGVIWSFFKAPVISGLLVGAIGAMIGGTLEYTLALFKKKSGSLL